MRTTPSAVAARKPAGVWVLCGAGVVLGGLLSGGAAGLALEARLPRLADATGASTFPWNPFTLRSARVLAFLAGIAWLATSAALCGRAELALRRAVACQWLAFLALAALGVLAPVAAGAAAPAGGLGAGGRWFALALVALAVSSVALSYLKRAHVEAGFAVGDGGAG